MLHRANKNQKGFTLIELLVVVFIIGLVATLALLSLNNARVRARDAKRWSDIRAVQSAVEICINQGAEPPDIDVTWNGVLNQTCGVGITFSDFLANDSMPLPPQHDECLAGDPTGDCYMYCKSPGNGTYLLYSNYDGDPPAGGLNGAITNYVAGDCIMSNDTAPTVLPDCDPVDGGTFCLGEL